MSASRVRVALIGNGRWGRNVARVLSRLESCELSALCDIDAAKLAPPGGVASRRLTTEIQRVFEDPMIQACAICTPPSLHAEQAIAALHAGKHVFVEKPMALSHDDAKLVAAAVEATSRRLMVGHIVLYHPAFRELLKLVRAGDLGRVRRVITSRTTSLERSSTEDPWWALAPHDISLLTALIPAPAVAIRARRSPAGERPSIQAEIEFADGTYAEVGAGVALDRVRSVVVIGDAACACFRDEVAPGRVDVYPALSGKRCLSEITEQRPLRSLPIPAAEPLELELRHFVEQLARGRPFRSDHEHGVRITEILEAGQRAAAGAGSVLITLPAGAKCGQLASA